jgi:hypothetical protein
LPEAWEPSEADRQFARERLPSSAACREEQAKFVDHWRQADTPNARKLDWSAAWRNWVRRAAERGENALDGSARSAEAERADCALARPGAHMLDPRARRLPVAHDVGEQGRVHGRAAGGTVTQDRKIGDVNQVTGLGEQGEGARRADVNAEYERAVQGLLLGSQRRPWAGVKGVAAMVVADRGGEACQRRALGRREGGVGRGDGGLLVPKSRGVRRRDIPAA